MRRVQLSEQQQQHASQTPIPFQKPRVEMTYRSAGADTGEMTKDLLSEQQQAPLAQRKGVFASCEWFKEKPRKRWPFALMLSFSAMCVLWIIMRAAGSLSGDILAGITGLILSIYGARHFRTLLDLKAQVDRFAGLNVVFKSESQELQTQVSKLNSASDQLRSTEHDLKETQRGFEDNVCRFRQLQKSLKAMGEENVAGITKIQQMSDFVAQSIETELERHERHIFSRVRDAMEKEDGDDGMNEDEYNHFMTALPPNYRNRFASLGGFENVAGKDRVIDLGEFARLCDRLADEEAKAKKK